MNKKVKKQKKTKNTETFITQQTQNTTVNNPINPSNPTNPSNSTNTLGNAAVKKNPSSILSLNAAHENDTTIAGLDIKTSSWIINILAALIGIFVFYFVPLLTNNLNRPLTAVLLNIIPNDLIMGFFIVEAEFPLYLTNIIWTPLLNVLANCISYVLIFYFEWSASAALAVNVFIWFFAIFLSLYI